MRRTVIRTGNILLLAMPATLRLDFATRTARNEYDITFHERIDRATTSLNWNIFAGHPQPNLVSVAGTPS
jgi:hypothetical protein